MVKHSLGYLLLDIFGLGCSCPWLSPRDRLHIGLLLCLVLSTVFLFFFFFFSFFLLIKWREKRRGFCLNLNELSAFRVRWGHEWCWL